jgi:hypothetical protein
MNNKIIIAAVCLSLMGCANMLYPNWQYVRVENQLPSAGCVYKMQESCASEGADCFEWYKKRATKYAANTVVITQSESQNKWSAGAWSAGGGDISNSVADYYFCNGAKNITPKSVD